MKEREELLMRAVELYYQQNLNQSAVAEILNVSRPMVSRLLNEARDTGVVEIVVHSKIKKNAELSYAIRDKFGLKDAIIVAGDYNYQEAIQKCGKVASEFLHSILENNMSIGITWGPMINSLCDSLEEKEYYNIHIIQTVGCLGTGNPHIDGLELAHRLSQKLNGTYSNIIAPVFVDNEFIQEYLLAQAQIASTINKAKSLDIVLTGIGSIFNTNSTLEVSGYLTEPERKEMLENGCVGHVLARFFDKNGKEMFLKNKLPIAAPLETLKNARLSIGLCAGAKRALPVATAIQNGFINTLIADETLAKKMLK